VKVWFYTLAVTLALVGLSCSQGAMKSQAKASSSNPNSSTATSWDQDDEKRDDSAALRRLESVTWDSVKHQLAWDVSKGDKKDDAYQPQSKDRYEINMDSATMTVNGESRRFSEDEAANVRVLMDFISRYALESTVWWENGEGDPVDGRGDVKPAKPTKPERRTPQIPSRDGKAIRIMTMNRITD
jgi:hypothetical protein